MADATGTRIDGCLVRLSRWAAILYVFGSLYLFLTWKSETPTIPHLSQMEFALLGLNLFAAADIAILFWRLPRHLSSKLALLLFSVFGTIIAAELLLHLFPDWRAPPLEVARPTAAHFRYDPVAGYSLYPDIEDDYRDIHTDALGFRVTGTAYDPTRPSIVFVGDSVFFGWGVGTEDNFVYLLGADEELNSSHNVVNAAVPAYGPANMAAVVSQVAPHLQPDIIVVEILWPWRTAAAFEGEGSDFTTIDYAFYRELFPELPQDVREAAYQGDAAATGSDDALSASRPVNWGQRVVEESYLIDLANRSIERMAYSEAVRLNFSRPTVRYQFQVSEQEELELARQHVAIFRQATGTLDADVRVVFFIHPFSYTIWSDTYDDWGRIGRQYFVDNLDPYMVVDGEAVLENNPHPDALYFDAIHLTAEGHRAYYEYFRELLQELTADGP